MGFQKNWKPIVLFRASLHGQPVRIWDMNADYRALRRPTTHVSQRLLLNSMPKSGTHLLTQVVNLLGYRDFGAHASLWARLKDRAGLGTPVVLAHLRVKRNWQRRIAALGNRGDQTIPIDVTMPVQVPVKLAQRWLSAIPAGCYISGHLPWTETTADLMRTNQLRHLVIIRDPRDVLVSFVHFVLRPEHILSRDFRDLSPDQRLILAMEGGRGPQSGYPITGLRHAFTSILAWQSEHDVLFLRFESLIGARGEGSSAAQRDAVRAICQHLDRAYDDELIEHVCQHAFDTDAATFRRGKIGAWQDELTPAQIDMCNAGFASILSQIGVFPS